MSSFVPADLTSPSKNPSEQQIHFLKDLFLLMNVKRKTEDKCLHLIRFLFNQISTSFTTKQYKLLPASVYLIFLDIPQQRLACYRRMFVSHFQPVLCKKLVSIWKLLHYFFFTLSVLLLHISIKCLVK